MEYQRYLDENGITDPESYLQHLLQLTGRFPRIARQLPRDHIMINIFYQVGVTLDGILFKASDDDTLETLAARILTTEFFPPASLLDDTEDLPNENYPFNYNIVRYFFGLTEVDPREADDESIYQTIPEIISRRLGVRATSKMLIDGVSDRVNHNAVDLTEYTEVGQLIASRALTESERRSVQQYVTTHPVRFYNGLVTKYEYLTLEHAAAADGNISQEARDYFTREETLQQAFSIDTLRAFITIGFNGLRNQGVQHAFISINADFVLVDEGNNKNGYKTISIFKARIDQATTLESLHNLISAEQIESIFLRIANGDIPGSDAHVDLGEELIYSGKLTVTTAVLKIVGSLQFIHLLQMAELFGSSTFDHTEIISFAKNKLVKYDTDRGSLVTRPLGTTSYSDCVYVAIAHHAHVSKDYNLIRLVSKMERTFPTMGLDFNQVDAHINFINANVASAHFVHVHFADGKLFVHQIVPPTGAKFVLTTNTHAFAVIDPAPALLELFQKPDVTDVETISPPKGRVSYVDFDFETVRQPMTNKIIVYCLGYRLNGEENVHVLGTFDETPTQQTADNLVMEFLKDVMTRVPRNGTIFFTAHNGMKFDFPILAPYIEMAGFRPISSSKSGLASKYRRGKTEIMFLDTFKHTILSLEKAVDVVKSLSFNMEDIRNSPFFAKKLRTVNHKKPDSPGAIKAKAAFERAKAEYDLIDESVAISKRILDSGELKKVGDVDHKEIQKAYEEGNWVAAMRHPNSPSSWHNIPRDRIVSYQTTDVNLLTLVRTGLDFMRYTSDIFTGVHLGPLRYSYSLAFTSQMFSNRINGMRPNTMKIMPDNVMRDAAIRMMIRGTSQAGRVSSPMYGRKMFCTLPEVGERCRLPNGWPCWLNDNGKFFFDKTKTVPTTRMRTVSGPLQMVDVTSMYPAVMFERNFPIGTARVVQGYDEVLAELVNLEEDTACEKLYMVSAVVNTTRQIEEYGQAYTGNRQDTLDYQYSGEIFRFCTNIELRNQASWRVATDQEAYDGFRDVKGSRVPDLAFDRDDHAIDLDGRLGRRALNSCLLIVWDGSSKLFSRSVERLYKAKSEATNASTRAMAKLLLNSMSGKLIQKLFNEEEYLFKASMAVEFERARDGHTNPFVDGVDHRGNPDYRYSVLSAKMAKGEITKEEYDEKTSALRSIKLNESGDSIYTVTDISVVGSDVVLTRENTRPTDNIPVWLGRFVYDYAREIMWKDLLTQSLVLYTDTDSGVIPLWRCEELMDSGLYSREEVLGKFTPEGPPIDAIWVVGPKNYLLSYMTSYDDCTESCPANCSKHAPYKIRAKGVRVNEFVFVDGSDKPLGRLCEVPEEAFDEIIENEKDVRVGYWTFTRMFGGLKGTGPKSTKVMRVGRVSQLGRTVGLPSGLSSEYKYAIDDLQ